ncbi:MAG: serine hydrolase [Algicola sp.]|nr:serine hydrolase [Algicola sp.]
MTIFKNKLKNLLGISCLVMSTFTTTSTIAAQPVDKMQLAISHIDAGDGLTVTVEQAMAKSGLLGLSVAVIEDYKISWTKTWGVKNAKTKTAIDAQTSFSTASISKAITATVFAILAEKGLIDLDKPVALYLKSWQLPDNEFTQSTTITLRHLLSHTAGTTMHGFKDFYLGQTIPSLVDVLKGGPIPGTRTMDVDFNPGSQWRYSGGGYVIAQVAIEDHLGKSLAAIAQEHLFKPLGLENTTMWQPHQKGFLSNAATAHNRKGEVIGLPICPQLAPSGMWSNPTDMATLIIEMQNALRGAPTKVISTKVAKLVTTEVKMGIGLGWFVSDPIGNRGSFSHGGANTGTGGHIYGTMTEGYGIAVFGNGPNGIRVPMLNKLKASIIKAHDWRIELPGKEAMTAKMLKNIPGRYQFTVLTPDDVLPIYAKDERLFTDMFGPEPTELFHIGDGTLLLRDFFGIKMKYAINPADNKPYLAMVSGDDRKVSTYDFVKLNGDSKSGGEWLEAGDYKQALKAYRANKPKNASAAQAREDRLNAMGYGAAGKKDLKKAIEILKLNVTLFPQSPNTYDSLAEVYMMDGQNGLAKQNYKMAVKLNPHNSNAVKMIEKL